jgi:hypothetical protein
MIRILIFALLFAAFLAFAASRFGWWGSIRRRPLRSMLLAALAFCATVAGGTKGGGTTNPPPVMPSVPAGTNFVFRLYINQDGRLTPLNFQIRRVE